MKIHNFYLAVTVIFLSACAHGIDINDPIAIASATSVERDDFKKVTKYNGPYIKAGTFDSLLIRAWKDISGSVDYQIYVTDYYDGGSWRFYDSAYDSTGNRLKTTLISKDVGSCGSYGCSHFETLGLNVTRQYLEKNQDAGIRFKISGRGGEEIFFIPSAYIKAFLSVAK